MNKHRSSLIIVIGALSMLLIAAFALWNQGSRAEEQPPILKYPDFPPTATIAPMPTSPPNTAGSVVLLSESFTSKDALSKWEVVDLEPVLPHHESVWTVEDGWLKQDLTANARNASTQETAVFAGSPSWTDYTISVKVYDQNSGTFGLITRRQGKSFYRYYALTDIFEVTPKHVLEKVIDGKATTLATLDGPGFEQRVWNTASMTVAGEKIQVRFNGKLILEATDSTLSKGQPGLYARAFGGPFFDDVQVTKP